MTQTISMHLLIQDIWSLKEIDLGWLGISTQYQRGIITPLIKRWLRMGQRNGNRDWIFSKTPKIPKISQKVTRRDRIQLYKLIRL